MVLAILLLIGLECPSFVSMRAVPIAGVLETVKRSLTDLTGNLNDKSTLGFGVGGERRTAAVGKTIYHPPQRCFLSLPSCFL